jgi:hypothetical protein
LREIESRLKPAVKSIHERSAFDQFFIFPSLKCCIVFPILNSRRIWWKQINAPPVKSVARETVRIGACRLESRLPQPTNFQSELISILHWFLIVQYGQLAEANHTAVEKLLSSGRTSFHRTIVYRVFNPDCRVARVSDSWKSINGEE